MADLAYTTLGGIVAGAPNVASDVTTAFTQAQTSINNVDAEQLTNTLAQYTGVNNGSHVGRGKSIITTTESRTNTAYGTLTTPDQVTGIVLPTDGIIFVAYQATWQATTGGTARAAIFLGSNQLKISTSTSGTAPQTQAASGPSGSAADSILCSSPGGLVSAMSVLTYSGDVTTGQVIGTATDGTNTIRQEIGGANFTSPDSSFVPGGAAGPVGIFAAAGTYTVSVQFKASSGSVTAKNRKLWVWTLGF